MDILYIIIIIVLAVLLSKKPKDESDGEQYYRGYRDGWKALGSRVKDLVEKGDVSKAALKSVIAGDTGENVASDSVVHATKKHAAAHVSTKKQLVDDEKRSIRNTNIVLYLASFLFVAAGAAFIAAAVDDTVKLFGVWLLVAAFYGVGLVMYEGTPKLKPAAIAFVGTGMALLPFAGVALHRYGGMSSEASWMVTSLVGVVAYYWAAIRLKSLVVSYLTMAFVISLVSSSVATASLPIVWGFTSIIVVSLLASLASYVRPSWLPAVFNEPVERTGQIVTPVALVASLFVYSDLSLRGYEIVFGVATAHYIVAWLQARQDIYENAARAVGHIALLLVAWDVTDSDHVAFGFWFLGLATVQLVYSLLRRRLGYEIWLWVAMSLQFVANLYWTGSEHPMVLFSYGLAVLGVSSFAVAYLLRSVKLALPGLGVTVFLPLVVMRGAIEPHLEWGWLVSWYLCAAVFALYAYMEWTRKRSGDFKLFVAAAFVLYVSMAAIFSALLSNGSGASAMVAVTALLFVASYVINVPWVVFAAAFTAVVAMTRLWIFYDWDHEWLAVGVSSVVSVMLFAASWVMLALYDERRRPLVLYSAWVIGTFGALGSFFSGTDPIVLTASLLVVAVATSVILEGRRSGRVGMVEAGAYIATIGAQRMFSVWFPDLNMVFYAHWWALVIAAVAVARNQYIPRIMVAMGFITFFTGIFALNDGGNYTLLFLLEHVVLVVAGVSTNKSWAIWWGITASSLAVLYFLRDIAFLAFGFLGLLLIGFVIWRLLKSGNNSNGS